MSQGLNKKSKKLSNQKPVESGTKLGYEDIIAGRPFADTWGMQPAKQWNYETGRLRALSMMSEGLSAPQLTPTGCAPKKLVDWCEAHKSTGYIPTRHTHQPVNESLAFTRPHLDRRGFPLPVPTYCNK